MKDLQIHIEVNSELYLKKPDSSELGRRIISGSIELINELGFEEFTFKKLGNKIGSPESSIYRYFESKHTLLIYLTSWFWSWIEYRLVFATINVNSPIDKLKRAIKILTQPVVVDKSFSYINEVLLHKIIITESVKVFHTKDVDDENKKGYFKSYKQVVQRVSGMVIEINPNFKFPHMLVSTVIEGANHQRYFAQHLPSLTNVEKGKENIVEFYIDLIFKVIK
ncbi:TetR family transcriptional regulator [Lutibacter profundi]|uniref:TetR family transcriptional regulator n=1 Tax=Lutibacter profundi TaxID=1622118 RepID=A0A0X8G8N4_9FLAO|nr:TetR/AcrR family transcriptional regulator [Lutibacter profundi]AMC12051.1 TetR family transcriptional regulator [Lutibacter profundi]